MSFLLTDPDVVLVVGESGSPREGVAETLPAGGESVGDVVVVDGVETAAATLADRDDVGCVVALDADAVEDVLATTRDADDYGRLPVVVYVASDDRVAATAATHEGCRYLPRTAGEAGLQAAVADALATYERRRGDAADSDIFRTLLEGTDVSIFAKDEQGRYVRTSQLLNDVERAERIGMTDREVFGALHPSSAESAYRDDLGVVETGDPIRDKRERFGSDYWSETTKLPWRRDGEVHGLVGIALDVTREEELERRLAERNDRFEEFASYVSHDLRTPLQVAFGALERARAGNEDALDKLEQAHDRIEEIIEDLHQLTQAEADTTVESTRLGPLVERIWRVTAPSTATLDVDLPDGTVVAAETEVLRPLVENLLKNAVDHGGPDVTVRVGLTEGRGFFVDDDGPGIPPEERQRVLEQGYTTAETGSGTGLAIVNETVVRQEWTLSIEESHLGSRAVTRESDAATADVAEAADGSERSRGTRVAISSCPVVAPVSASPGDPLSLSESDDVGDVEAAGSAEQEPATGRWTIRGGGRDVWSHTNEFQFVHTETTGPVRIEARIESLADVNEYSKAGVMVRTGLDEDATFGYVGQSSDHGSEVIRRSEPGLPSASSQCDEPSGAYPWYRLDRVGDTVTLSLSADGDEFHPVDQRSIDLEDPVHVGLVANSHVRGETCEAVFADVSVAELDVE